MGTLTGNAQTADVHGPEPRPAVELPILRNNALVHRPGSSSTHFPCRRNLGVGRPSIYAAAFSRTYPGTKVTITLSCFANNRNSLLHWGLCSGKCSDPNRKSRTYVSHGFNGKAAMKSVVWWQFMFHHDTPMMFPARAKRRYDSWSESVGCTMRISPPSARMSSSLPGRNTPPGPGTWAISPLNPTRTRCSMSAPGLVRPRTSPGLTGRPAIW